MAGVGTSASEFPGTPGPIDDGIDLELLGSLGLEIPELDLPLIKPDADSAGLLHLGALGAGGSRSSSTSETESLAASRLLSESGGLDLSAYEGDVADPAYVDLTSTIEQLLGDGALDTLLSEARIELGAVGSEITKNGTEVNSQYRIADLGVALTSPLLGDVTSLVDDVVGGVVDPLNDAIGPDGSLSTIVNNLVAGLNLNVPVVGGLTTTLETPLSLDVSSLTDSVREGLLQEPLDNSTAEQPATVSIDLNNGSVSADLGGLLLASNPDFTDLNDLPANTDVLSDSVVNALTQGVLEALTGTGPNSLTSKAVALVEDGLYGIGVGLELNLNVSLLTIPAVDTTLSLLDEEGEPATLGGILGVDGYTPAGLEIADEGVLGGLLTPVLGVVTTALDGLTSGLGTIVEGAAGEGGILDTLQPTINGVLNPIVTALVGDDGAIKGLLDGAATITINEQPQELATPEPGDLGDESLSVRALSVSVLPGLLNNPVKLELASSTVKALDEAPVYDTAIEVTPGTIEQGETTTITGTGFAPNETVDVVLEGESIGTATTNESGEFTLDYTAPEDSGTGAFDVVATGEVSQTPAEGILTIEAGNAGADPDTDTNGDVDVNGTPDTDTNGDADVNGTPDTNANADVNADADVNGDVNTNASSSASASANADDDSNASAQAAAQAAATADADATASAAADADATAAAQSAATADASSDASADVSSDVNASAQAAAQAAANADASSASNAEASAASDASANAAAASQAASNADSSSDASSEAAASSDSDASALASASSDDNAASDSDSNSASDSESASNANASSASDGQQISMELENDRLQVGETQVAHGHGFQPGESVTATQYSTPYDIGTSVADDNGDVTFTWSVPNGTEDGNHVVELTGATSGSVDATFEVYSTGGGGLSPTGGDMALPLGGLAAAMLLAGAGVWFAVRRLAHA